MDEGGTKKGGVLLGKRPSYLRNVKKCRLNQRRGGGRGLRVVGSNWNIVVEMLYNNGGQMS